MTTRTYAPTTMDDLCDALDDLGISHRRRGSVIHSLATLHLDSLTALPEGVTLRSSRAVSLSRLPCVPAGVTIRAGWWAMLNAATELRPGVTIHTSGSLHMSSLRTMGPRVTLDAGADVYLDALPAATADTCIISRGNVTCLSDKDNISANPDVAQGVGAGPPPVPVIENIHQAVYAAASRPEALAMDGRHRCENAHCRAGWVIALAGAEGKALEAFYGTLLAAMLIYDASDPVFRINPARFLDDNEAALADMKRLAEGG